MPYSGEVTPGGPSAVRELDEVVVRKASVGPMDNNAYLLTCRASGSQLLVDAAADPDRLLALVREGSGSARLAVVVTTHRHADHHGALDSVVAVTGATTAAGADDVAGIPVPTRRPLRHGDVLTVGHLTLEVVALRGHTLGSIALAYREPDRDPGRASGAYRGADAVPGRVHLFTGDSLFPGGVGNTQRDPDRFAQLLTDVRERVFDRFDDGTWVYPGHGADTTLGAERPHLEEWRRRGW
ncbi:MBL fold metallo-hydrolase [Cellulomonas sp. ATA003]|uniref:MBL fold metallo-hydrolase n=1 Tax=Cellulomonas sp. ATA003 TaxID=3073064 RepID=UPI002873A35C|nr:MBL fold metallo-hydrolase [Cellulomonas sp. ATA003]WNB87035.1 MBL fold metallo-hydrolase [Cellulomonas sp. ATA003]